MKTHHRSRAREIALQALYRLDLNAATSDAELDAFLEARLRTAAMVAFARSLVAGVKEHRGELDSLLDARSENWRLSRMAATDRAILRIGAYELLHTDVPGPVAVDEAIELAKRYGTDGSGRFVAGILGRLLADRAPTAGG